MIKKILKLLVMPVTAAIVSISILSFTQLNESGDTWTTNKCTKTENDTTTITSACETPATDGPCDRKKSCP